MISIYPFFTLFVDLNAIGFGVLFIGWAMGFLVGRFARTK